MIPAAIRADCPVCDGCGQVFAQEPYRPDRECYITDTAYFKAIEVAKDEAGRKPCPVCGPGGIIERAVRRENARCCQIASAMAKEIMHTSRRDKLDMGDKMTAWKLAVLIDRLAIREEAPDARD